MCLACHFWEGAAVITTQAFLGGEQPVPNEVPGKGPSGQKLCLSLRLAVAFSMLLADMKHTGQLKTTTNHSTACAWCFLQDRARPWGNGVFIKSPATWSFQFKKNVDKWFTDPKPPLSERIRSLVSGEGQRVTASWRTRGRHINVSGMSLKWKSCSMDEQSHTQTPGSHTVAGLPRLPGKPQSASSSSQPGIVNSKKGRAPTSCGVLQFFKEQMLRTC